MQKLRQLFARQITPGRTFIPEIDGFRFVALISVVIFHIYGQTMRYYSIRFPETPSLMLHHADRGVRLFFVISGFIVALPFARHYLQGSSAPSIKRYFIRRITRLEPPYIASLLLFTALGYLVLHEKVSVLAVHLLATAAYCHSLLFGKMSTISVVAWSLEVEAQFYILAPVLAFVFAIRKTRARRLTLIAGILVLGVLQVIIPGSPRWQASIGYYLQYFLAGFLLTDLYLTAPPTRKSWAWDGVSLLLWPVVFLMPDEAVQWTLPCLTALLYWAGFHGRAINAFFRNPVVVCTGGACYSTYLLHFPIIALATRLAGHQTAWLMWLWSVLLIGLMSGIFFLAIEKPCMDPEWPRKLMNWLKAPRGTRTYAPMTQREQTPIG